MTQELKKKKEKKRSHIYVLADRITGNTSSMILLIVNRKIMHMYFVLIAVAYGEVSKLISAMGLYHDRSTLHLQHDYNYRLQLIATYIKFLQYKKLLEMIFYFIFYNTILWFLSLL